MLAKLGLTFVHAAAVEAAAADGAAGAAGFPAGETDVDGGAWPAEDGVAVVKGLGKSDKGGIRLGGQADAKHMAEVEVPPIVEKDEDIGNLGTEEFEAVGHSMLDGLENYGRVVRGVVGRA